MLSAFYGYKTLLYLMSNHRNVQYLEGSHFRRYLISQMIKINISLISDFAILWIFVFPWVLNFPIPTWFVIYINIIVIKYVSLVNLQVKIEVRMKLTRLLWYLKKPSQVWDSFWKALLKWSKTLFIPRKKLFLFSRYSSFCFEFLVIYKKDLIRKISLISIFMTSQPG